VTGRICDSCRSNAHRVTPRHYDGVTVHLDDQCAADPFRRERVIAEARGVPYDVNTTPWPVRR
jgi:hypothetical protein